MTIQQNNKGEAMNDQEIRIECLRLADGNVYAAAQMEEFIKHGLIREASINRPGRDGKMAGAFVGETSAGNAATGPIGGPRMGPDPFGADVYRGPVSMKNGPLGA